MLRNNYGNSRSGSRIILNDIPKREFYWSGSGHVCGFRLRERGRTVVDCGVFAPGTRWNGKELVKGQNASFTAFPA